MQQICIFASCLGVPLAGRVPQDRRRSRVLALKESQRPGDPADPSLRLSGYQGGRPSPGSSARRRLTFLGPVALQSSGVLVLAWSISLWGPSCWQLREWQAAGCPPAGGHVSSWTIAEKSHLRPKRIGGNIPQDVGKQAAIRLGSPHEGVHRPPSPLVGAPGLRMSPFEGFAGHQPVRPGPATALAGDQWRVAVRVDPRRDGPSGFR